MKKINSIHFAGRQLLIGTMFAIVIPSLLYGLNLWLKSELLEIIMWIFIVLGLLVLLVFFVLLQIELRQDKKISKYYDDHKNVKISYGNGNFECSSCGNRCIRQKDRSCNICGVIFSTEEDKTVQDIIDDIY